MAWRRWRRVPNPPDCLPWLYRTAGFLLRNSARRPVAMAAPDADRASPPDDSVEVLDALARLRTADQEVLRLAAWEGLDAEGLGVALGVRPAPLASGCTGPAAASRRTQPDREGDSP